MNARFGRRYGSGFGDATGVFGMGDAGGRRATAIVVVTLTAEVIAADAMVTNSPAGMIAVQSFAVAVAGRVAGVIRATVAVTNTCAMTTTVSTAVATTVATAIATATTMAPPSSFLRLYGADEGQISG